MKTGFAALVWTPDEVRVRTGGEEFKVSVAVSRRDRFALRLWSDHSGNLFLRSVADQNMIWTSVDSGLTFKAVPAIPARHGAISAYNYKLHCRAGLISALNRDLVWLYSAGTKEWQSRDLPPDMQVVDISIDGQGGLWYAGSVRSQRLPNEGTEAAMRYQRTQGAAFEARSPHLSWLDGIKVIKQGGLSTLRTVDAEAEPVVATSLCSWFLEDDSSFLFTFLPERTFVFRLKGEMIRELDRSADIVRIFTYGGNVWSSNRKQWKRYSMIAPLEKALTLSGRKIHIRGLDVWHEKIAVVVEFSPPGSVDIGQDPEVIAICLSADDGRSFEVAYCEKFRSGEELMDVAWL